jgi:hypothetical protein
MRQERLIALLFPLNMFRSPHSNPTWQNQKLGPLHLIADQAGRAVRTAFPSEHVQVASLKSYRKFQFGQELASGHKLALNYDE